MAESSEKSQRRKRAVKEYFSHLFEIRSDMVSYDELHEMMEENTKIHGSNMWILIMAIFIASIGLNVNSTAVIIGAMLISPLMSGILTMGYSLATSDLSMLRKAFTRFLTQVVISLLASTVYFLLTPLKVPTDEMIARTSPTLWDALIALFGGIAGAIGNTRKGKGNVIPGVAIATALMPPLCTVGYGLATMQTKFILGALYLFAINALFIMLSTAFVTKLMHIPSLESGDPKRQKHIKRLITAITILTVIPSILIGGLKVYQTAMEQSFSKYVSQEFNFSDAQVVKSDMDMLKREVSVSLVGAQISDDVLELLEQALPRYNLNDYTLSVMQNNLSNTEYTETVTIAVQEKTIGDLQAQVEEQREKIENMEAALSEQIDCKKLAENAGKIFAKLSGCGCGVMSDSGGEYILLCASANEALLPEEEQAVQNWLRTETGLSRAELNIALPPVSENTELEENQEEGV